jgi:hypothetical protein
MHAASVRRLVMHAGSPLSLSVRRRSLSRIQIFLPALIYLIGLQVPAVRASWVDPDTPKAARKTKALSRGDHREYELVSTCAMLGCLGGKGHVLLLGRWLAQYSSLFHLQVFSDEFEQGGRTFHDGKDPRWTAIKKNDCKQDCLWRCFYP